MLMQHLLSEFVRGHEFEQIAEIGVWRGVLSEKLIVIPSVKVLMLVDPWSWELFNPELKRKAKGDPLYPQKCFEQVNKRLGALARKHS